MSTEYFEHRERALLGERYDALYAAPSESAARGVTVSALRTTPEQFAAKADFSLEASPFCKAAFVVHQPDFKPGRHPYHHAGVFYSQEPSASSAAPLLGVRPGMRVLDLCAAPGGKSSQLAAALQGRGVLVSNEYVAARAEILKSNLERMGVSNAVVLNETPARIAEALPEFFDRVLVDAPCSGEGMFRKDKKMVKAWEEHGPSFFSKIQKSIITQAAQMLRPGGMLLYSTCTFSPEENEQTIEYLLQEYPEFQICEMEGYEGFVNGMPQVTESRNEELKKTVRIFPHRMKGEGHFLALLQKGEAHPALPSGTDTGKPKKLPEEFTSFLSHVHREFLPSRMELRGDKVYYMPADLPSIRGIRFLRTGLLLGELKKNRFEPSQAFAMNLKMEEYDQILNLPVSDERVIKYLKGDTLDVEDLVSLKEKGWYLVCVDGYPLGFGKLINQMLKNKYLPGWRWNG